MNPKNWRVGALVVLGAWGLFQATAPIQRPLNKIGSFAGFLQFAEANPMRLTLGIALRVALTALLIAGLSRVDERRSGRFYTLFLLSLLLVPIADLLLFLFAEI